MNYEEEFRKYLKEKAQKSKVNAEKEIKELKNIADRAKEINKLFEDDKQEER